MKRLLERSLGWFPEQGLCLVLRVYRRLDPEDCVVLCQELLREANPKGRRVLMRVLARVYG